MHRFWLSLASLIASANFAVAQKEQSADALHVIESTRGGRHWVDEKTAPPRQPDVALDSFEIADELRLELFAAEPLVMDPVAITFDAAGRMFAVEYGDYPIGPENGGEPLSRIVLLEDGDGDGRADQRTVFADKLNFCHSAMPYRGGLLIGEQTRIVHLKDTDGDNVADVRDVLFDGFTPAHPQMQIGNPRWGIDNEIYLNYGPGKITSPSNPDSPVNMPRKDFVFDPQTMKFHADGGWGQFGNTVDRWGNRFFCTNRNPIITTSFSSEIASRNPFFTISKTSYDVAASGSDSRVYPLVKMKSNYLSHAGTHTAACGVTAFTGDALGNDRFGRPYQDSVFVCEPIGHLVTRSLIDRDGARLTASRAQEKTDFLASNDPWFRPASLATGPDGALYLADMYRLWVEHPKFLPPEIAAQLDWRAGEDRGRIYRIVGKNQTTTRTRLAPAKPADRLRMLDDANGWSQFIAHQLIVEDQDKESVVGVRERLHSAESPSTRLHSLWILSGIHELSDEDLIQAMEDQHWRIRADAARIARSRMSVKAVQNAVVRLVHDNDPTVKLQVTLALGNASGVLASIAMNMIAITSYDDPLICDALLSSLESHSCAEIIKYLVGVAEFDQATSHRTDFIRDLSSIIGTRGDQKECRELMETICLDNADGRAWWQFACVSGFADGLQRHRGSMGRISLAKFLSSPPTGLEDSAEHFQAWLDRNKETLFDPKADLADRVAAIGLLMHQSHDETDSILAELLTSRQAAEIQVATVDVLARSVTPARCDLLLQQWPQLSPLARAPALAVLLRRTDATTLMLQAMKEGVLPKSLLTIDQRVRLLKHRDESVRTIATEILGGAVSANRREVAKQYQVALTADASAAEGAKIFRKACSNCHRIGDVGHQTGPDLSDTRNRSAEALLYDILDPNAKVEPRYTSYSILTRSGEVYSGLIASDSGDQVVLQMAENKKVTVARDEIEQIKSNDISLMPEGIEKDVTPQQMADLLAFLTNRQ